MNTRVTFPRVLAVTALFALLFAVTLVFSMAIGPTGIDIPGAVEEIIRSWTADAPVPATVDRVILFRIRLPRLLFAGITGASLATAGVLYQALLRNPLADPFILGISGGAALGAVVAIIAGLGAFFWGVPALSFLGAACAMTLVFFIGRTGTSLRPATLLLAGVIVNAFFSALIMFFLSLSTSGELLDITHWLMGNLGSADRVNLSLLFALLAAGFCIVYAHARPLNLIVLGEETAGHLGVNVEAVKLTLFITGSLLTALAVAFSGIIGFVGLIVPHMVRMIFGSDHRILLPAAFFFGGIFLMAADTLARSVIPYADLPVGVVTALSGAPFFVYLLKRRDR
ncbi:MAG: iron ABC transporter permease [Syntrophales bacterium]|jgi:iron complex transport system permease protein|nr:iron ABC transporter permease [Syntrophales bacterium]MCK9527482.1 iron ABC transporter permease [Syntrophales bacterium]MDX9922538.1 iron ABC transporter permease [Syntrophales bacterium]